MVNAELTLPDFPRTLRRMSSGATFETFEQELNRLVESFGKRLTELKQPGYQSQKNILQAPGISSGCVGRQARSV